MTGIRCVYCGKPNRQNSVRCSACSKSLPAIFVKNDKLSPRLKRIKMVNRALVFLIVLLLFVIMYKSGIISFR